MKNRKFRRRVSRPVGLERLEPRQLLSGGPVIDPIASGFGSIPAGKTLQVPVTGSDAAGNPLTYSVTSNDGALTASVHTGNPFIKISVAGFGDMTVELFKDYSPDTVGRFLDLVESGFYTNKSFYRVIPGFVAQGGGDASGGGQNAQGFSFNDEFNTNAIYSGTGQLGFANSGSDTNGSQFFITSGAQRFLDFNQEIFGQVVRGFDVLAAINAVGTSGGTPTRPVTISSISVVKDTTDAVIEVRSTGTAGAGTAHSLTVTASDGIGGAAQQAITVTPFTEDTSGQNPSGAFSNDPPVLNPIGDTVTPVNTAVSLQLGSADIDGGTEYYDGAITDSTPNGTISVDHTTGLVTVTPNAGYTGPINIVVGVREGTANTGPTRGSASNNFDTQKITIGVGATAITAQPTEVSAVEGHALSGVTVATFTDPNASDTAASFTAQVNWGDSAPVAGTVVKNADGTYSVSASHTYAHTGIYSVHVTINSGLGAVANATGTAVIVPQAVFSNGLLTVNGTSIGDVINITNDGTNLVVAVDNTTQTFLAADVKSLAVNGLDGRDVITLGANVLGATILGGQGADTIVGGGGNDSIAGGLGNDSLNGGPGNDTILGVRGNDTILGGRGADSLNGGRDNDSVAGGPGPDTLIGGVGDDTLFAGGGNNSLAGGAGDDTLLARNGTADTLVGGLGTNSAQLDSGLDSATQIQILLA